MKNKKKSLTSTIDYLGDHVLPGALDALQRVTVTPQPKEKQPKEKQPEAPAAQPEAIGENAPAESAPSKQLSEQPIEQPSEQPSEQQELEAAKAAQEAQRQIVAEAVKQLAEQQPQTKAAEVQAKQNQEAQPREAQPKEMKVQKVEEAPRPAAAPVADSEEPTKGVMVKVPLSLHRRLIEVKYRSRENLSALMLTAISEFVARKELEFGKK